MTWGQLRLIPPLETYPRAVAAVQTPSGKLVMLAGFLPLLSLVTSAWIPVGSFLVLASLVSFDSRRALVAVGTVVWAFFWPANAGVPAVMLWGQALVFLFAGLMYAAARRFSVLGALRTSGRAADGARHRLSGGGRRAPRPLPRQGARLGGGPRPLQLPVVHRLCAARPLRLWRRADLETAGDVRAVLGEHHDAVSQRGRQLAARSKPGRPKRWPSASSRG